MSALITAEGLVRLDAALAYIDEHPEQHDQSIWFERTDCGTTMCLAGVIAVQAGFKPAWWGALDEGTSSVIDGDGYRQSVSDIAMDLLGIDWTMRSELFLIADTRADLGAIRDRLAGSLVGAA